nr:hydrolase [Rhizobium wenxiniae]
MRIDRRPFPDMASHDAAIVENWNVVVGQDDDIWHLGDFMSVKGGECAALLAKLNGRKHLIVGNNDPGTTTGSDGWHSVQHYAEIREGGHHLILCHYAFRTWNQMGKGSINLHGHSHGRLKLAPRQFDVGVDSQGLKPVSLTEILDSRKRTKGSSAAI